MKGIYDDALPFYDKYLIYDPENADVKKSIESIKAFRKGSKPK
ncbi:MAG: hypothetical protein WCI97_09745 [Bacteroidota bacterium]